jgi:hypothetical protein
MSESKNQKAKGQTAKVESIQPFYILCATMFASFRGARNSLLR